MLANLNSLEGMVAYLQARDDLKSEGIPELADLADYWAEGSEHSSIYSSTGGFRSCWKPLCRSSYCLPPFPPGSTLSGVNHFPAARYSEARP